jgi:hypothetical protein
MRVALRTPPAAGAPSALPAAGGTWGWRRGARGVCDATCCASSDDSFNGKLEQVADQSHGREGRVDRPDRVHGSACATLKDTIGRMQFFQTSALHVGNGATRSAFECAVLQRR